jgi:exoribonuclease-2
MFPEELSAQILSLGAAIDSYSLSCGVILTSNGEIESFEVCPSKIRITRRLSYTQLNEIINDTSHKDNNRLLDHHISEDLIELNKWAVIRHHYRIAQGALDVYMRTKTELYLSVKKDPRYPLRSQVSGYTVWTNDTSISLVSEYMILMSQTIGVHCATRNISVLYKTQAPLHPLQPHDVALQEGETPYLRATRLILSVRPANDTRFPGRHCSSGADAYVQCTSPIRRYNDLYNHYRLKASMHAASLGEEWSYRAPVDAGISSLDLMSTAEQRLATLNAIKLVTPLH